MRENLLDVWEPCLIYGNLLCRMKTSFDTWELCLIYANFVWCMKTLLNVWEFRLMHGNLVLSMAALFDAWKPALIPNKLSKHQIRFSYTKQSSYTLNNVPIHPMQFEPESPMESTIFLCVQLATSTQVQFMSQTFQTHLNINSILTICKKLLKETFPSEFH